MKTRKEMDAKAEKLMTELQTQHTPTPWILKDDRSIVNKHSFIIARTQMFSTNEEAEANAAFIVRAVNAYEELKKIEARYEALIQVLHQHGTSDWVTGLKFQAEAIARAEGGGR